jgi:hypothetical protein
MQSSNLALGTPSSSRTHGMRNELPFFIKRRLDGLLEDGKIIWERNILQVKVEEMRGCGRRKRGPSQKTQ